MEAKAEIGGMKTIKEVANEYAETRYSRKEHPTADAYSGARNGFIAGVEFAQRWIPVKLELPSVSPYLGKDIKSGKVELFHVREESFIRAIDITHWRPIEYK